MQRVTNAGYETIVDALEECIRDDPEAGCALAIYRDGRPVVDAWVGSANGTAWREDTTTMVFSVSKGITTLCAQMLVDRGELDPGAVVTRYWPAFGTKGKEGTTLGQLMDHSAGLPMIDDYPRLFGPGLARFLDWERVIRGLEATAPITPPGSAARYHALTFGHLVGEVIRRVDGRTVGTFFREEVAEPLELDFRIGTSPAQLSRLALPLEPLPPDLAGLGAEDIAALQVQEEAMGASRAAIARGDLRAPEALDAAAVLALPDGSSYFSVAATPPFLEAEIPGANGTGTARALARLYGALALGGELDGVRLLSENAIRRACARRTDVPWQTPWGLGWQLFGDLLAEVGGGPDAFGHAGAGGNFSFADPTRRLGFGLIRSRHTNDPKPLERIIRTLYRCLDTKS